MHTLLVLSLILVPIPALTQQGTSPDPKPVPIQDNSFLVEEAYNQGRGIVQHISTFAKSRNDNAWAYTFTQEWPVRGQRHQLSYSIPVARVEQTGGSQTGMGDIALNYRYQIKGVEGGPTALAPRLTILLPTGTSTRGLGAGGTGLQLNIPFSAELPASLVAHTNAGMTYTPNARNTLGDAAATTDYSLGQSVIWLAHPKFNVMLEAAWSRSQEVAGPWLTERGTEFVLSPGVRGAIDFASGLQIVPGLAFPFGVGASRGLRSVFAYLSFEHPFGRRR